MANALPRADVSQTLQPGRAADLGGVSAAEVSHMGDFRVAAGPEKCYNIPKANGWDFVRFTGAAV